MAGLLAWIGFGHAWETPLEMTTTGGGVWLARFAGVGLSLLFVVPMALAGLTAATYLARQRIAATHRRHSQPARGRLPARGRRHPAAVSCDFRGKAPPAAMCCSSRVDASKSMTIQDESSQVALGLHAANAARRRAGPRATSQRAKRPDRVRSASRTKSSRFLSITLARRTASAPTSAACCTSLYDQYGGRRLRGVLVLSDGRNNGDQRIDPFAEARRWRRLRCPIHTFAFGNPNTPNGQRDVAVTGVTAAPPVVPIKGKLTVRATIDAHGFENSTVRLHLFLDDKEVEVAGRDAETDPRQPDHARMRRPGQARRGQGDGESRQTPLPGELNKDNNQLGTFVTVVKGGVNVLLIDKDRAWEPQMIYDALAARPAHPGQAALAAQQRPRRSQRGQLSSISTNRNMTSSSSAM